MAASSGKNEKKPKKVPHKHKNSNEQNGWELFNVEEIEPHTQHSIPKNVTAVTHPVCNNVYEASPR